MYTKLASLLILALSAAACSTVQAEEVRWLTDGDQAARTALKEERPLLLYFTTPGCRYCVVMKKDTFLDAEVAAEINKTFVPVMLPYRDARSLVRRLGISSFPTLVVVLPNGEVLDRVGYKSTKEFKQWLADLTKKKEYQQWLASRDETTQR